MVYFRLIGPFVLVSVGVMMMLVIFNGGVLATERALKMHCSKLPGIELVHLRKKRFVLVGEPHGTKQIPKLFGDIVCAIGAKEKVLVLLEIDDNQQQDLDIYFNSSQNKKDQERFLKNDHWSSGFDGRASIAILDLLDYIAKLKRNGYDVSLKAFHPSIVYSREITDREKAIAASWTRLALAQPDAMVIILTGTYHIGREPARGGLPAATHLRQTEVLTIAPSLPGGRSWNCKATGCGVNQVDKSKAPQRRGLYVSSQVSGMSGKPDLIYSTGMSVTESLPANPNALKKMSEIFSK